MADGTAPTPVSSAPGLPLMVFAAGFGRRMGALTADRPKPLIEIGGRALIDHALAQADGAAPVVVNTHYRADMLAAHLAGRGVLLSHEPEILDTGGGLKAALPWLGGARVATLNSDSVWTGRSPLSVLSAAWDGDRMEVLLLLLLAERARGRSGPGDFARDGQGRVTRGGPLVYPGAQIVQTAPVAAWPERVFSMNRLWDAAIARGTAYGVVHPGGWCDVGRPEGIAAAEAMLAETCGVR